MRTQNKETSHLGAPLLFAQHLLTHYILCPHCSPRERWGPRLPGEEAEAEGGQAAWCSGNCLWDRDWFQIRACSLTNSVTWGKFLKRYEPHSALVCKADSPSLYLLCIYYVPGLALGVQQ